ncbi:hypothetical protein BWQ96_09282 [Gracilariopsis chorda]|uniref:Uncharacterized protein n=1 Tax=Gracilariopsis chorda TaxID=448386 RepID=A0A2V3IFZ0_9FLOR|nr:hypothetical protein BWQ96_09282 [Gracilariopsis chorda]|eukprot:PXF40987.1 hypothetical protein BWQ96_09282 [Gracilariopsis chorda]
MISVSSDGEPVPVLLADGELRGVELNSRTVVVDALDIGNLLALGLWMIAPDEIDGLAEDAKGIPDKDKLVLGASDTISVTSEGATKSPELAEGDGVGRSRYQQHHCSGCTADLEGLIDIRSDALTL